MDHFAKSTDSVCAVQVHSVICCKSALIYDYKYEDEGTIAKIML
jgi:hypothetical protein